MTEDAKQCKTTARNVELLTVIKIGGAAITNKSQFETLNEQGVREAAICIAQVKKRIDGGIVVVHGAGSFGHFTAKKCGLRSEAIVLDSFRRDGELHEGCAKTRLSVLKLNSVVLNALHDVGVAAIGMSPLSLGWWCEQGNESNSNHNTSSSLSMMPIERAVRAGFIPVIHGDVILSNYGNETDLTSSRVRIMSGDEIVYVIAKHFHHSLHCVSFLTDVDGVFDSDPKVASNMTEGDADGFSILKQEQPKLLRDIAITDEFDCKTFGSETAPEKGDHTSFNDVTGAMKGKLKYAAKSAKLVKNVRIANLLNRRKTNNVLACLPEPLPEDWIGTELKAEQKDC